MRSKPFLILGVLAALPALAQTRQASTSTSSKLLVHPRNHGPMKLVGVPAPDR
jgi:hypothetical protein